MGKGDKVSIELVGGPPWGFRLGGGADFGCPLEIAKLRKRSKAFDAGLAEGDVVTSIDHQDVSTKSHGDAMKIIEVAGSTLKLQVVKGVGPSAGIMNSSMMADSMIINQTDGLSAAAHADQLPQQQPLEATVVRSREPSIARSYTEPTRERSVSRTITILPAAVAQKVEHKARPVEAPAKPKPSEPWTVDVASYQFVNNQPTSQTPAQSSSLNAPQPKQQPPATSPKPKFKANTLPRPARVESGICPVLPSWGAPPVDPALKHVWTPDATTEAPPKTSPTFKVAKVDAKTKTSKWQPTVIHPRDYDDSRHKFNPDGMMYSPQPSVVSAPSTYPDRSTRGSVSPRFSAPVPQPPPPPQPSQMSPRRPVNHVPGMVNPLICDDSHGDFGANPIVRPNRKMYSDSAFYDAPGMAYPTIHEQVALCKEIASFLESNQNKRSRGGRMFMKRKQRAEEWSMDSEGQQRDLTHNYDLRGSEQSTPHRRRDFGYNVVRHHPDPIKSKLSAAELEQIQHNQDALCKHDSLPPNMAFDINEALSHSRGKAGQIFEKRKQRAEKYVVDENSSRNPMIDAGQSVLYRQEQHASPWQATMNGRLDSGYQPLQHGYHLQQRGYQSGPAVRAPASHHQPLNVITNQQHPGQSAPVVQPKYKTFKSVAAPGSGSGGMAAQPGSSHTLPRTRTRLDQMILANESQGPTTPSSPMTYSNPGLMENSYPSGKYPSTYSPQPAASYLPAQTHQARPAAASSNFTLNLRRPKDYQKGIRGPEPSVSVF